MLRLKFNYKYLIKKFIDIKKEYFNTLYRIFSIKTTKRFSEQYIKYV